MSAQVLFPKQYARDREFTCIFLAGPIRNAPPWHEEAVQTLSEIVGTSEERLFICSPKREKEFLERVSSPDYTLKTSRQRQWEWFYQERAAFEGGILFWLPREGTKEWPEKAYGAMTQMELGHWLTRAGRDRRVRVAIGSDGQYNHELPTIEYDILRLAPHIPRFWSLRGLCEQGIFWALNPMKSKKKK